MKYPGFKKMSHEDSSVMHLSISGWNTLCGLPVKEGWYEYDNEDEKKICKNCRASIIKRSREDYARRDN